HLSLPVHRFQPDRAPERRRLQGRDRDAHRQRREGRCQAGGSIVHRPAAFTGCDGRRQHDGGADRRSARLGGAGQGDCRHRHRRRRRTDGGARAIGRQSGGRREAADPLREGRDALPGDRGRADRSVDRRGAGAGASRRADLSRQHLPPGEQPARARQGDAQQVRRLRHPLERFERHAQRPLRAFRVERLARERLVVVLSLAGVVALAWLWLWRQAAAMHMSAVEMPGMAMNMPAMTTPDALGVALVFLMWAVMMAGMMLPSAAPTILLYGAMVQKHAERGSVLPAVWIFVAGYLLVWAAFSLGAALLQALLQHASLLDAMLSSSSKALSALLLSAAGIYQLTPLKDRCLSKCRAPLPF